MADTILETLEEDIESAFRAFAAKPTNSARMVLRSKLLEIAGAMEVEANLMDQDTAYELNKGITDLKALAELALVAPKELLITQADNEFQKPAVQKKPSNIVRNRATWWIGAKILTDIAKLFSRK